MELLEILFTGKITTTTTVRIIRTKEMESVFNCRKEKRINERLRTILVVEFFEEEFHVNEREEFFDSLDDCEFLFREVRV